jgi:hypothetical protein
MYFGNSIRKVAVVAYNLPPHDPIVTSPIDRATDEKEG